MGAAVLMNTGLRDIAKKEINRVISDTNKKAKTATTKVKLEAELVLGKGTSEKVSGIEEKVGSLTESFANLPSTITGSATESVRALEELRKIIADIDEKVKDISNVKITLRHTSQKDGGSSSRSSSGSGTSSISGGQMSKLSSYVKGVSIPNTSELDIKELRLIYLELMKIYGLAEKIPKAMFGEGENYINFSKERLVAEIEALQQRDAVLKEEQKVEKAVNDYLKKQISLRNELGKKQQDLREKMAEMYNGLFYGDENARDSLNNLLESIDLDKMMSDGNLDVAKKVLGDVASIVKEIQDSNKKGATEANKALEEAVEKSKQQLELAKQRRELEEKITNMKSAVGSNDDEFYSKTINEIESAFKKIDDHGLADNIGIEKSKLDEISEGYKNVTNMINSAYDAELKREKAADESFKFQQQIINQQNNLLKEKAELEQKIQKMYEDGIVRAEKLRDVEEELAKIDISSPYDTNGKANPLGGDVLNNYGQSLDNIRKNLVNLEAQEKKELDGRKKLAGFLLNEKELREKIAELRTYGSTDKEQLDKLEQELNTFNLDKLAEKAEAPARKAIDEITVGLGKVRKELFEIEKATIKPASALKDLGKKLRSFTGTQEWRDTSDANIGLNYIGSEEQLAKIRAARQEIAQLVETVGNISKEFTKEEAEKFTKQYENAISKFENAVRNVQRKTAKSGNVTVLGTDTLHQVQEVEDAIKRINEIGANANIQWTTKTTGDITRLTGVLTENDGTVKTLVYDYNNLTTELSEVSVTEKQTETFMQRITKLLRQRSDALIAYIGTFASFYQVMGKLREGATIIKQLDTNMTELRRVSGATRGELEAFKSTVFDIGREIGSAGDTIIKLAADYARLGYSLSEASELAKASAMYMNVGFIDDATFAMESLTSTMKAYGMQASEVADIVD